MEEARKKRYLLYILCFLPLLIESFMYCRVTLPQTLKARSKVKRTQLWMLCKLRFK